MSSIEVSTGEIDTDVSLIEQRRALAAKTIVANLELLDQVVPTAPIDHTALDQETRKIAQVVIEADSRV